MLRLILLGVGVAILVGIYLYGRPQKTSSEDKDDFVEDRPESVFKGMPPMLGIPTSPVEAPAEEEEQPEVEVSTDVDSCFDYEAQDPELAATGEVVNDRFDEVPESPSENEPAFEVDVKIESEHEVVESEVDESGVIQLAIVHSYGDKIKGIDLLNACAEFDLEFGDMGIFHRYRRHEGIETQVFHVANVVEPGTFPLGEMDSFETKGIALFMQATDDEIVEKTFDEMLETARQLSISLDAELVDEKMQPLSVARIEAIREQLARLSS